MVTLEDVVPRLAAAEFRTTVEYTGPLEHQYLMTHFREDYLSLWLDMRELLATTGVIRPIFKSPQVWKYVGLPDGFTYWVMPMQMNIWFQAHYLETEFYDKYFEAGTYHERIRDHQATWHGE